MRADFRIFAACLIFVAVAACGKDTKVGTEELLDIEEQKQKERLGEILRSPEPTAPSTQGAIGQEPTQKPGATTPPAQAATVLEVTLVNDHPYILPQENLQAAAGTILRITNKDDNPRRFVSKDGTYDSGTLAVGATKDIVANVKGDFQLEDPNAPFVQGSLTVY